MNIIFNKINQRIKSANNILVISHQKPDGDALGSSLAMFFYISSLGKNATVFLADQSPSYLDFLPGIENVSSDCQILSQPWDIVMFLDSSNSDYTLVDIGNFKDSLIINIDHHISNLEYGDINCVDSLASSTCEIIYKFLISVGDKINKDVAMCLLCGILSDTGNFLNSATTIDSINISSQLVERGAKIHQINNQVDKNRTIGGLRLWGDVLARLKSDTGRSIAYTYIKEDEYSKYQVSEEELDGLVNFLNVISDTHISALFRINKNNTKVSIRTTRDDTDVAEIAKRYGGGGHRKAAGFTLSAVLNENDDLLSFLEKR